MSTIKTRMDNLQAAHARKNQGKGDAGIIEKTRAMLEQADGQVELDMRPGENIFTVSLRRLQVVDGWNLAMMPGDALEDKLKSADRAANGKLDVSGEAKHAARHWMKMHEGI
jgi:hypothetical protein